MWHGADCLPPEYRRCLVSLSPGGSDADVVREFDLASGKFVEGGFTVPESKNTVTWVDRDTLLVAMAEGEGTVTRSGYARIVKEWKRGTPWSAATKVAEATERRHRHQPVRGDGRRHPPRRHQPQHRLLRIARVDARARRPLGRAADPGDGRASRPWSAGQAIATLVEPLGQSPAGLGRRLRHRSRCSPARSPRRRWSWRRRKSQAIEEVAASDNVLWVKALDDVSGKLFALRRQADGSWSSKAHARCPTTAPSTSLATAGKQDIAFATVEGMLTPTDADVGRRGRRRSAPCRRCRPSSTRRKFTVDQRFATSKDGTRVPYFLVRKKGVTRPTGALIHAYGGFRAAQTPDLSDRAALSLRPARPVLGRGRRRLCARQHPRRRRIWARLARDGAAREAAEQLRRSRRGRRAT